MKPATSLSSYQSLTTDQQDNDTTHDTINVDTTNNTDDTNNDTTADTIKDITNNSTNSIKGKGKGAYSSS